MLGAELGFSPAASMQARHAAQATNKNAAVRQRTPERMIAIAKQAITQHSAAAAFKQTAAQDTARGPQAGRWRTLGNLG